MELQKNKYFYLLEELSKIDKSIKNDKTIIDKKTATRHILGLRRLIDQSFNLF